MFIILARNWLMLLCRGILALIFGLLCFAHPDITLTVMVIMFGAYALADGIFAVSSTILRAKGQQRWWSTLIEGAVGVIVGVLVLSWPAITAFGLLYLIAVWAILTGVLKIAAAIQLRRQIIGEWLLVFTGASSLLFGLILFMMPGAGALVIVFWIGAYAMTLGMCFIVVAFRLQRWVLQSEMRAEQ